MSCAINALTAFALCSYGLESPSRYHSDAHAPTMLISYVVRVDAYAQAFLGQRERRRRLESLVHFCFGYYVAAAGNLILAECLSRDAKQ